MKLEELIKKRERLDKEINITIGDADLNAIPLFIKDLKSLQSPTSGSEKGEEIVIPGFENIKSDLEKIKID